MELQVSLFDLVKNNCLNQGKPVHISNYFSCDFVDSGDIASLLRKISTSTYPQNKARVFVNGNLVELSQAVLWSNPPKSNEKIETWANRVFKKVALGMVLNSAESIDDEFLRRFIPFVNDLLDSLGYPVGGLELVVILGNYGYTPFGVHRDVDYDASFHFVLGPNTKKIYYWTASDYLAAHGSLEKSHDPEAILASASCFELSAGDLFVLPRDGFHIGYAPEFTISVNLETRWCGSNAVTRPFFDTLKSEVLEYENLNERYIAPLPDNESDLVELRFLDRLPGFCHNISLAKYVDEKLRQIETLRFSNRGFACPSKRTRVDWSDISSSSFVLTKGFPIYCSDVFEESDSGVTVFARGRKTRLDEPDLVSNIVRDLNAGKTVVPGNWQTGLESKENVTRLLFEFLYQTRAIEPLSQDSR